MGVEAGHWALSLVPLSQEPHRLAPVIPIFQMETLSLIGQRGRPGACWAWPHVGQQPPDCSSSPERMVSANLGRKRPRASAAGRPLLRLEKAQAGFATA